MKSVNNPRGVAVTGGSDLALVFAPLSLGALERLKPEIDALSSGQANFGAVIDIAHASLKRNYPTITRDDVGEFVDMGNMQDVISAVMNASGMSKKGEGEPAGE